MKKYLIIILVLILVFTLSSCTNLNANNSQFVGEWYYSGSPDEGALVFEKDGTFYFDSETYGRYKAEGDTVILTYSDNDLKVYCYLNENDEYTTLDIDGSLYVKGYDSAVSYYETNCYLDPSDIWAYDFSGDYYQASDDSLAHLSEYDQMVEIKNGGGYTVNQQNGGFTLRDNYSGYRYGSMDTSVTVDIDRENYIMRLVDPYGYIDEFTIDWCEETQEFYFVDDSFDTHWFRLTNVQ